MTEKKKLSNQDMQRIIGTPYNDLSGFERGVKLDAMLTTMESIKQTLHQNRKVLQDMRAVNRAEVRLLRKLCAEKPGATFADAEWNEMLQVMIDEDKGLRRAKEGEVIEKGDWVVVRYKGFNDTDGAEVPGTTGQNELYVGANQFIASFEDAIMGMKIGDTVEKTPCGFPANYPVKEMAGTFVMFDITIVAHKKPLNRVTDAPKPAPSEIVGVSEGGC
jgi:FKBP-type peptidyl-prolyl cis-trans isomerase (trigger factor)